jgi:exodeoxyribonuclease VII large subunit
VANARAALATHAQSLKAHDPKRELVLCHNRISDLHRRVTAQPPRFLQNALQRFQRIEGVLRVLGPEATLQRGYSITTDSAGNVIRTIAEVNAGSKIRTRVTDGEFESEVTN